MLTDLKNPLLFELELKILLSNALCRVAAAAAAEGRGPDQPQARSGVCQSLALVIKLCKQT